MTSTKTQRTTAIALLAIVISGVVISGVVTAHAWPGSNPPAPVGGPISTPSTTTQTQPVQQTSAPASPVDEQQAIAIALAHAGLTADQVTLVRAHQDYEDRTPVWDIEFYAGATEYDYEIAVDTGAVHSYDRDIENYSVPQPPVVQPSQPAPAAPAESAKPAAPPAPPAPAPTAPAAPAGQVSEQQAIAIAIAHAGLTADQVTLVRAHQDYEDRTPVWDIEFYSGTTEYDYEIAVDTGAIRSYDRDIENYSAPRPPATQPAPSQPSVPQQPAPAQMISLDQAKAIALAKVPGATNIRIELDRDDRRQVYEGEVFKDGWEYDFEIDAQTGGILEWGSEPIHD